MSDRDTARRFLSLWFDGVLDNLGHPKHHVLIWSAPSRKSTFTMNLDRAADEALSLVGLKQNVYFGVCSTCTPPVRGRGAEDCITCVPGVWADIDIESGEGIHKKKVAPSEAAAYEVLKKLSLPPSILVHSGHGLQAYWKFVDPIWVSNEEERHEAREVVRLWELTIRAMANSAGWTIDHCHDITRVFRVPGTKNLKSSPVPVKLLSPGENEEARRYERSQIEEQTIPEQYTPDAQNSKKLVMPKADLSVDTHDDVELPLVVASLQRNDPTFKRTWLKQRPDLDREDSSQSHYDFHLAKLLGIAGCSQQIIWETLYCWRKMNNENADKMFRRSYWVPTIARAIAAAEQQIASQQLKSLTEMAPEYVASAGERQPERYPDQEHGEEAPAEEPPAAGKAPEPADGPPKKPPPVEGTAGDPDLDPDKSPKHIDKEMREKSWELIRTATKIKIAKIIQHGIDDALFSVLLEDGTDIRVGTAKQLASQEHFSIQLNQVAKITFTPLPPNLWSNVARNMVKFAELIHDPELERSGSIMSALIQYCGASLQFVTKGSDVWRMAVLAGTPYVDDGHLYVVASEFMSYVNRDRILGEMLKKRDFDDRMRTAGFTCAHKPTFVRAKGLRVGRRYWSAPVEDFPFLRGGTEQQQTESSPLGEGRVLPMAGYWRATNDGNGNEAGSDGPGSEPAAN